MIYLDICKKRYACRNFNGQIISNSIVQEILKAGNLSPTALNLQNHCFGVVKEPENIKKVVDATFGQNYIINASHVIVLMAKKEKLIGPESEYAEKLFKSRITEDRPLSYYVEAYKRVVKDIDFTNFSIAQTYFAAINMVNSAAYNDVCSNLVAAFDSDKLCESLNIDSSLYRPSLLIPLGKSDDDIPDKTREPLNSNIIFEC